jgi:phospholipid N-methyltransferase
VTSRNQTLLFARNFLRHPKVLGSVVPSSRFLVDQLLRHADWSTVGTVVEYGPGVGTFTNAMLRRMKPDARLIAIELNEEFVEFLRATCTDPRLRVVRGSALEVDTILREQGRAHADAIVSGIPFSTIEHGVRAQILRKTRAALGPGGRFLVYQFSRAVEPYLRESFRTIEEEFVPFNILPARIFSCGK